MAKELAFVLLTPWTLRKSRTGGVIGRIIVRTGLDLVGARMFGPSGELVEKYAEMVRRHGVKSRSDARESQMLADYISTHFTPDPKTGQRRRVMMLLFEGEDAIEKIDQVVGGLRTPSEAADTVRATYGDLVLDEQGGVKYLEPAVIAGSNRETVIESLRLWSGYSEADGGILDSASDVAEGDGVERTLVMLKPDNFRFPSIRPGVIIDIFAGAGLRIIGAKVHRMSVAEAEEFYGPVREVLREKLKSVAGERSVEALEQELGIALPDDVKGSLADLMGPCFADAQFNEIVKFMTGVPPTDAPAEEKSKPGRDRILALVYAGRGAIEKIRKILGPTDPKKALPGSVRKEYGEDIMVNAAHASDSPENAEREMRIIKAGADSIREWVEKYHG